MIPTRIGHAHLKVRDLARAIEFYTRFFNLELVEQVGDHYAFLTGRAPVGWHGAAVHHEIALQNVGPQAPSPSPIGTGLYHVAFEVPDKPAFARAYQKLVEAGVPVATVDHFISWAMYFDDPDGNGLEVYCDTRRDPGGQVLWHGQNGPLPREEILDVLGGQALSSGGTTPPAELTTTPTPPTPPLENAANIGQNSRPMG